VLFLFLALKLNMILHQYFFEIHFLIMAFTIQKSKITTAVVCFALFVISHSIAKHQQEKNQGIIGMWQTTIEDNGSELILILEFENTATDSISCLVHRPEMGMNNVPYSKFILLEDSILLPGLKAKINGDRISGKFTAFGPKLDIEFRKISEIPSYTIDCPEKTPEWEFETNGSIWSSPIIYDNDLFFGNDSGLFYCIDLSDKTVLWQFQSNGPIRSKACIMDQLVSFSSDDGYLYALDIRSGKLKWKINIGNAVTPRVGPAKYAYDYDFLCSSPIYNDRFIYVGRKDSCLYVIGAEKGALAWKFKTKNIIRSTPAIGNEMVYVGSWDHFLYALNKKDGSLIWKYDAGSLVQSSPLIVGDKVIAGSRAAQVFALNRYSGKEIWKTMYWGSWVESSPVFYDDKIYIGSSDFRKIFAMDPSTGKVMLSSQVEGWSWPTPAVSTDFIFSGSVGTLHYLDGLRGGFYAFDRKTGEPEWQIKVEDDPDVFSFGFASSPSIWNDWIFVGGLDGNMYGMKVK